MNHNLYILIPLLMLCSACQRQETVQWVKHQELKERLQPLKAVVEDARNDGVTKKHAVDIIEIKGTFNEYVKEMRKQKKYISQLAIMDVMGPPSGHGRGNSRFVDICYVLDRKGAIRDQLLFRYAGDRLLNVEFGKAIE